MNTATTIAEVRSFIANQRKQNKKIGFVPTMGALHAGHMSLVEACKKNGSACVMSIFVNPTQFGPQEDFTKYPRPIENDKRLAEQAAVDLLFLPDEKEIYPAKPTVFIEETIFSEVMCGAFRPDHFRGVCTVVNKFLNIVQPDELYLGQKDAQQLRIIQEMVKQLRVSVNTIGIPTLREENGLAMSSRNKYLSEGEKNKAAVIYSALSTAKDLFESGEKNSKKILQHAQEVLKKEPLFKIQYLELRKWEDFQLTDQIAEPCILAVAGYLGTTRLIDNVLLK